MYSGENLSAFISFKHDDLLSRMLLTFVTKDAKRYPEIYHGANCMYLHVNKSTASLCVWWSLGGQSVGL